MFALAKRFKVLESPGLHLLFEHSEDKVIIFMRAGLLFVFNFHPTHSHTNFRFEAPPGKYRMIFNTDMAAYGGHNRLHPDQHHLTIFDTSRGRERNLLRLYLPTRTAMVLQPASPG